MRHLSLTVPFALLVSDVPPLSSRNCSHEKLHFHSVLKQANLTCVAIHFWSHHNGTWVRSNLAGLG